MELFGSIGVIHRVVLEVRYDRGYLYLDRCGRLIHALLDQFPAWQLSGEVNPQAAPFQDPATSLLVHVGATKYDFSITQGADGLPDISGAWPDFAETVGSATDTIHRELTISMWKRVGFRVYWLFEAADDRSAARQVRDVTGSGLEDRVRTAFGAGGEVVGLTGVLRIEAPEDSVRVRIENVRREEAQRVQRLGAVGDGADATDEDTADRPRRPPAGERQRSLTPDFAVMVDVDVFRDNPVFVAAEEFVEHAFQLASRTLEKGIGS